MSSLGFFPGDMVVRVEVSLARWWRDWEVGMGFVDEEED